MKTLNILFVLLMLFAGSVNAERYALIIAVGDYPDEGEWPDISSTNDVIHIRSALRILNFKSSNIISVIDSEATKAGILKAFDQLTQKLKPGDIVYIHFSGHGQQVMDDNGDEIDFLDEAIVPYDSYLYYKEGFCEGDKLIRDDLIGQITDKIREKCGKSGQVILVLDSCHSGTGTRGMGKARGTDIIMAPDDFKSKLNYLSETSMGIGQVENANAAPMASFFGASAKELNYETLDDQSKPVGSLSYAISTVFANMKRNYSFEELFDRVKLKMKIFAPRQSPQWEGPKNILFLEGHKLGSNNILYNVNKILDERKLQIAVGTISRVYEGSTIEVYSLDSDKMIARGLVTSAFLTESIVTLDNDLNIKKGELIKIKITENALAPLRCVVSTNISPSSPWNAVVNSLLSLDIIEKNEINPDIFIVENRKNGRLKLMTKDGIILFDELFVFGSEIKLEFQLGKVLKTFTQGKFLRSFDNPASDYNLDIEIIEVSCDNPSKQINKILNTNNSSIKIGTCIVFKITNNGSRPSYYSLIDIQPDNIVNVLIPVKELGYTAEEFYLKPGKSHTTHYCVEIGEPLGAETLKLLSSNAPLDLSGVLQNATYTTRGFSDLHPFEGMMASAFNNTETRGAKIKRKAVEQVGTTTVFFNIVK